MTKDEALKLALEALEDIGDEWGFTSQRTVPKRKEAITAIKEALMSGTDGAQPEQEPVAWLNEEKKIIYWHNTHETDDYHGFKRTTPLYTTPPQRKPLTDEEIQTIAKEHIAVGTRSFEEFVRRIEAAHGIKGEA